MTRLGMCMLTAALCAATTMGCGGGSVQIGELGAKEAGAICDRLVRCGVWASQDLCVAFYEQVFDVSQLQAGVGNGTIHYDPDKAGDCLDAVDGVSCDTTAQNARVQPSSCKDFIKGTVADGGACKFDTQCVSDSCNVPACPMSCCAGTCDPSPPAPAAIGQPCEAGPCVDGAYCDATTTCAALLTAGQTCTSSTACGYGLTCAGQTTMTCVKTPVAGDACLFRGTLTTCVVQGLKCDATQHCATLLGSGAACDPANNLCKTDFTCDATSHTCTALPGVGQACTQVCTPGAHCVLDQTTQQRTCQALKSTGEACTANGDCKSDTCDTASTMKCIDAPVCI